MAVHYCKCQRCAACQGEARPRGAVQCERLIDSNQELCGPCADEGKQL